MNNPEKQKKNSEVTPSTKEGILLDKVFSELWGLKNAIYHLNCLSRKKESEPIGTGVLSKKSALYLERYLLPEMKKRQKKADELTKMEYSADVEKLAYSQHNALRQFYRDMSTIALIKKAKESDRKGKHQDHLRKLSADSIYEQEVIKGYSVWVLRRELGSDLEPISDYEMFRKFLQNISGRERRVEYIRNTLATWEKSYDVFKTRGNLSLMRKFLQRHDFVDPGEENLTFVFEDVKEKAILRIEMLELQLKTEESQ